MLRTEAEKAMIPQMLHCMQCGEKLQMRYLPSEGREIPYCESCGDFRFPVFNTAVSMIVTCTSTGRILLIRQYGRQDYILVAGYVNRGEDAENAVSREVMEEVGLKVTGTHFNHSHFFTPSNTLMLNFTAEVDSEDVHTDDEVDSSAWFTPEEARQQIRKGSLAQAFLEGALTGVYAWPERNGAKPL